MATTSALVDITGSLKADYQDTVVETYEVTYDTPPTNLYTALILAQGASGVPVPPRRTLYAGTGLALLYAQEISPGTKKSRLLWQWNVTYTPPAEGENPGSIVIDNPLLRPPVYNVEFMDREYVVEKARNVSALSHGDGKGGNRAADTLGPVVNAAGKRPDEPIVDTDRLEVLVIRRNYAELRHIININRFFKRTTNTDSIIGYTARQLKYLLTSSEGQQFENGIYFWPGTTHIQGMETTDLILDNVGYDWWDSVASNWKRAVDKDGEPTAEPINLKLDGDKAGDNTTTITYRHLAEVAYAPFLL